MSDISNLMIKVLIDILHFAVVFKYNFAEIYV